MGRRNDFNTEREDDNGRKIEQHISYEYWADKIKALNEDQAKEALLVILEGGRIETAVKIAEKKRPT